MTPRYTVTVPSITANKLHEIIKWCDNNISHKWEYNWAGPTHQFGLAYIWCFEEQKDCVFFNLRWL
jgi:hypothetical protein